MGQKNSAFIPLKIAVLTVSDSRTSANDSSGDYLVSALTDAGHQLADRALCPDNLFRIRAQVSDWIVDDGVQVVLINGAFQVAEHELKISASAFRSSRSGLPGAGLPSSVNRRILPR